MKKKFGAVMSVLITVMLIASCYMLQSAYGDKEKDKKESKKPKISISDSAGNPKSCYECHEDNYKTFYSAPHGIIKDQKYKAPERSCDTCHGSSEVHVKAEGEKIGPMLTFNSKTPVDKQNKTCLQCHSNSEHLFSWQTSAHSRNNISCVSCHSSHSAEAPKSLKKQETTLCYDCHREKKTEFKMPSKHPLEEGKMQCTSCHNTHVGMNKGLKGENQRETCVKCHAEHAGPFAFEHAPVAERCDNCHKPHGSINNNLLAMPQPMICLKCHSPQHVGWTRRTTNAFNTANIDQRLTRGLAYQQCTHCHTKVHGSDQSRSKTF